MMTALIKVLFRIYFEMYELKAFDSVVQSDQFSSVYVKLRKGVAFKLL